MPEKNAFSYGYLEICKKGVFQKLPSTVYCTMTGLMHNWLVAILTGICFTGGGELFTLQTFPIFDVFVAWAFIKNFTFTVWNLPRCLEICHKKVKNEKTINIFVRKKNRHASWPIFDLMIFSIRWKCCNSILWWHSNSGVASPKIWCQNAWF